MPVVGEDWIIDPKVLAKRIAAQALDACIVINCTKKFEAQLLEPLTNAHKPCMIIRLCGEHARRWMKKERK